MHTFTDQFKKEHNFNSNVAQMLFYQKNDKFQKLIDYDLFILNYQIVTQIL